MSTRYKMVSLKTLDSWYRRINTIALDVAFGVADEIEEVIRATSKYMWGQRVIVDGDTIAIFRHYENEGEATERVWVELPDGEIQWRDPKNVIPLPGGQL